MNPKKQKYWCMVQLRLMLIHRFEDASCSSNFHPTPVCICVCLRVSIDIHLYVYPYTHAHKYKYSYFHAFRCMAIHLSLSSPVLSLIYIYTRKHIFIHKILSAHVKTSMHTFRRGNLKARKQVHRQEIQQNGTLI